MTLNAEMVHHLRALTRLVYVVTDEEDNFIKDFQLQMNKHEDRTWVYNWCLGLKKIGDLTRDWTQRSHTEATPRELHEALTQVYKDDPKDKEHFYIFTDPERIFRDEQAVRRVLNIIHQLHVDLRVVKCLIFVSTRRVIPEKLARYFEIVDTKGLQEEELTTLVTDFCRQLQTPVPSNIGKLFRGFTSFEVEAAITQSVVRTKKDSVDPKRVDPVLISKYKRNQIKKTDLVQIVDSSKVSFDSVGGAECFKEWARSTQSCWTEEGQAFGLVPPRGVLLMGVYGCGKSLSAKALATEWKLPLIQFEMGKLRNSAVGESEANLYRALRIVESVSPCVTEETEVTLADGTSKPIGVLWQESLSGTTDLSVQCWNEKTLRLGSTRVSAITCRQAEAFRIDAANGYYLNATENHLHYIMRGGLPDWVSTDELLPGDMMAVSIAKYPGDSDCTRFHPVGMRNYEAAQGRMEFRRGGGGFRDAIVPKLPRVWSTELGWVLGILEGDGFIGANDGIGLVNTSEGLLSYFEHGLINQFGLQATRHENNSKDPILTGLTEDSVFKTCWTSLVTNQLAAEFLREARKHILTAPPEVRAAFLAGWIDADGCIGRNKIALTVKHPKMWAQRQLLGRQLIQSLGVIPSKFDFPSMEITGSRAVHLAGIIREYLVEKSVKATQISSSSIGFDRGSGFACGQLLHEARKASGTKFSDLGASSGVTWSYESGRVPVSERHLINYIEKFGSSGSELKRILEADCRWVQVKSIEPIGTQDVYDLVCEGEDTHSFIANGLITHNCIMWIDEAEKSLSGGDSSAQSDAGTTSRLLGILSTWTQESNAPACLVMTANSLKTMPAEMVNRMPERFFFDIPDEETLIDIIKIHAKNFSQDVSNFNLATLAEKADGLVGREIEQAVEASMVKSFNAKCKGLDYEILLEDLTRRPRIIKTMSDEIHNIIDWVGFDKESGDGIRARFASKGRSTQFKTISATAAEKATK